MATSDVPVIGDIGARLDLLIRQGATFGPNQMTVVDTATGLPINLTGATLRAQIRKTADSPTVAATAVFVINNAAGGEVTWEFTEAAMAALTCDPDDPDAPASRYVWDMEVQLASGRVIPLLYGDVRVWREVTKP